MIGDGVKKAGMMSRRLLFQAAEFELGPQEMRNRQNSEMRAAMFEHLLAQDQASRSSERDHKPSRRELVGMCGNSTREQWTEVETLEACRP